MKFEVGKYYKHPAGDMLHVVCWADTFMYGSTMIAEDDGGELLAVGDTESNAVNYHEITKEEWEAEFLPD